MPPPTWGGPCSGIGADQGAELRLADGLLNYAGWHATRTQITRNTLPVMTRPWGDALCGSLSTPRLCDRSLVTVAFIPLGIGLHHPLHQWMPNHIGRCQPADGHALNTINFRCLHKATELSRSKIDLGDVTGHTMRERSPRRVSPCASALGCVLRFIRITKASLRVRPRM